MLEKQDQKKSPGELTRLPGLVFKWTGRATTLHNNLVRENPLLIKGIQIYESIMKSVPGIAARRRDNQTGENNTVVESVKRDSDPRLNVTYEPDSFTSEMMRSSLNGMGDFDLERLYLAFQEIREDKNRLTHPRRSRETLITRLLEYLNSDLSYEDKVKVFMSTPTNIQHLIQQRVLNVAKLKEERKTAQSQKDVA